MWHSRGHMTRWLRWQVESRNPSAPPLDVEALQWALPSIDEAAAELVGVLALLNDHIGGQIAGAAALAGAALRRNDDVDVAGVRLFRFAELVAGNVGWKRRRIWSPRLPPQFEPSYDVAALLGKLQAPFDAVCAEYPIRPPHQPYVALLAALRVVAWAHEHGAIDQTAGRDLIARYVVAGSRTEPRAVAPLEPRPEREPPPATTGGPIAVAEDEEAIVNLALPSRGYPCALALTGRAVYVLALHRWSFRPWFIRRMPLEVVERVTVRRRRRTLRVHFAHREPFVWRAPLALSPATRARNDVLARMIADAFRTLGVPVVAE